MAKTRTRKPWGSVQRRKKVERLMEDTEIYTEPELKEKRQRIAKIMRMQDTKLRKEQKQVKALGTCIYCNMVLTTTGMCPMSCK